MVCIAITGGLASGKSTMSAYLRHRFGIAVLDADDVVSSLYRHDTKIIQDFEEEFGFEPSHEEISEITGLSVKHIKQAISSLKTKYVASIDTPIGKNDEGGRTLADVIPDNHEGVDQMLDNKKIRSIIVSSLRGLSKRLSSKNLPNKIYFK